MVRPRRSSSVEGVAAGAAGTVGPGPEGDAVAKGKEEESWLRLKVQL